jgi:predicted amidohydrolase
MNDSLRLAVVQFSPAFGDKQKNFERLRDLSAGIEADIIVFPELCTTGYFFQSHEETAQYAEPADGRTTSFFRSIAEQKRALVVAGFAERDGDRLYNSALVIQPEQETVQVYRKTHLFYKERFCFDEGDTGFFVVRDAVRNITVGIMICYDWRFPEASRVLTLQGAELIVCPSNLVTDAWRLVMPARAIENKVYVAVANRAGTEIRGGEELLFKGNSTIYGYNGSELARTGPEDDEVIYADIMPQATHDKSFNPLNDVLRDRRPEHYTILTAR